MPDTTALPTDTYTLEVSKNDITTVLADHVQIQDTPIQPYQHFVQVLDVTYPTLSNIAVSNSTATSATISWDADEGTTAQVEYGLDASYGNSTSVTNTYDLHHEILIADLLPGNGYHFRVRTTDVAGNETISADYTFNTATPFVNSAGVSSYFMELNRYRAYATFDVGYAAGIAGLSGELTFTSSRYRRKIATTAIDNFYVIGNIATFSGPCTVNNVVGYSCTANVTDNGDPGVGVDEFELNVTGPEGFNYSVSGVIASGEYLVSQ